MACGLNDMDLANLISHLSLHRKECSATGSSVLSSSPGTLGCQHCSSDDSMLHDLQIIQNLIALLVVAPKQGCDVGESGEAGAAGAAPLDVASKEGGEGKGGGCKAGEERIDCKEGVEQQGGKEGASERGEVDTQPVALAKQGGSSAVDIKATC